MIINIPPSYIYLKYIIKSIIQHQIKILIPEPNSMLRTLTKLLSQRIGFHTQTISKQIKNFNPTTENDVKQILRVISKRKEFIRQDATTQAFVDKIEYIVLKKSQKPNPDVNILPTSITPQTIAIYKQIRHLGLMTQKFRYAMFKRIVSQLRNSGSGERKIREVESLLWFLYREFGLYRDGLFVELAEDYTLRLYQYWEFLGKSLGKGKWETYIRLSAMLQHLGHQLPTAQIPRSQIQVLNYSYIPYIPANIYNYRKTHDLTEPFLIYLCNKYIDKEVIRYDDYLQYIEKIDGESNTDQIQRVIDPMNWNKFVQLFWLYSKACQLAEYQLDTILSYKICQFFWRLCQTKQIQIQPGIRILQIMGQHPEIIDQNTKKILQRVLDPHIEDRLLPQSYKFLPGNAFLIALKAICSIPKHRLSESSRQLFIRSIYWNLENSFIWSPELLEEVLSVMEAGERDGLWKVKGVAEIRAKVTSEGRRHESNV